MSDSAFRIQDDGAREGRADSESCARRELPKILWLKRHMPAEVFECVPPGLLVPQLACLRREVLTAMCLVRRQCQFFDLPDFLTYRATSDLARSNCSLACKCSYVPPEIPGSSGWSAELFNKIGLDQMVRVETRYSIHNMTCLLTSCSNGNSRSAGQGRLLRFGRPTWQDRTHPHGRPARRRGSL